MTHDEIGRLLAQNREIERLSAIQTEAEKWKRMTEEPLKALGGSETIRALQSEIATRRIAEKALGIGIHRDAATFARDLNRHGEFVRQLQEIVNGARALQPVVPEAIRRFREIADTGRLLRDSYAQQIAGAVTAARQMHELAASDAARAFARSALVIQQQLQQTVTAAKFGKHIRDTVAALDVGRQIHESMIAAVRRADFAHSLDSVRAIAETAASLSRERWPELYEETEKIEIDATGAVRMGARAVSQFELQAVVSGIVDRSIADSNKQLADQLASFVDEIKKLKDPWYEKLLVHFVLPLLIAIIVAFVTPLADRSVSDQQKLDERSLKKLIRQEATATVGREQLASFRFVTATQLFVRAKSSSKSPVIGALRFGQTVELIEKDGDWSLIQWTGEDDDAVMMRGWVFARYLSKFR